MDERQMQIDRRSGGPKGFGEIRLVAASGLERMGTRAHEILLAEGHFRCPHCRRADINEVNAAARRMR